MDEIEIQGTTPEEGIECNYNFKESNSYNHAILEFKAIGYKRDRRVYG